MKPAGWKQGLDRVPLVGRLFAVLRGVLSLPVWRQALRTEQDDQRSRLDRIEHTHHELVDRMARQEELWRQRCDTLEQQLEQRFEQRLQQQRLELQALQRTLLQDLEYRLSLSAIASTAAPVGWQANNSESLAEADRTLATRALQTALPESLWAGLEQAPDLSAVQLLQSPGTVLPGSDSAAQNLIVQWQGLAHLPLSQQFEWVREARIKLAAEGWMALCLSNPEHPSVLATASHQGCPGLLWPRQAQAMLQAAGFAEVQLVRFMGVPDLLTASSADHAGQSMATHYWVLGRQASV